MGWSSKLRLSFFRDVAGFGAMMAHVGGRRTATALAFLILGSLTEGMSILLVEQNAHLALKLVDYVHVMSKGQVVYSGRPDALKANDEVKSNYLGI